MVILSSPSGAGKTTLSKLLSRKKNFYISVSHTTRKPRIKEVNAKDYYFIKIIGRKKHADWFLDANEAKRHKLANHLRVPKFNIKICVDIDFE